MQGRSGAEYISYGRLRPGPGFQLSRAVLYYSHRVVPFVAMRNLVANAVASRINRSHPTQKVLTGSHQQRVEMLDEHGITIPEAMLLPTEVAIIRSFLDEEPISRRVSSAHYTLNAVLNCPYLLDLA